MGRLARLLVLIVVGGGIAGFIIFSLQSQITSTTPTAAQATIVAGILTLLGIVFSAVYKEISSFYQQTIANDDKKWALLFPWIHGYYYPWITAAKNFQASLNGMKDKSDLSDDDINDLLYYFMLFYGCRIKFLREAGGLILLSSVKEGNAIEAIYHETVEPALDWEGASTHKYISYLQNFYMTHMTAQPTDDGEDGGPHAPPSAGKDSQPKPAKQVKTTSFSYMFFEFKSDIEKDAGLKEVKKSLASSGWARDKMQRKRGADALGDFALRFEKGIEKLYSAWG
jgi:hypothetical protein